MLAAQNGYLEIVRELIKAKAQVNAANHKGFTALMCAVIEGHIPCVQLLLQAGADRKHKNHAGQTAYDFAQQLKDYKTRTEILRLLNEPITQ